MKGHVQVYRNLHRTAKDGTAVYSQRNSDGIVEGHYSFMLLENCVMRVSNKGNKRVRKEKRKNVHAYIQGRKISLLDMDMDNIIETTQIAYNPYKNKTFIRKDNKEPVHKAKYVMFNGDEVFASFEKSG